VYNQAMHNYEQIFSDKNNILFVTAHPDDVIVFYGALIHRLVGDKKNIYIVTVTNGCRGSRESDISESQLGRIRVDEEAKALEFLGVPKDHLTCLMYKDGEVESNYKLIGEISKYIRKYKADVVCTHEPTGVYLTNYNKDGYFVQHRDHRKVGEATVDACYPFSRDKSFFPEHSNLGLEPHTVKEILLTDEIGSNFRIDYTDHVEIKKSALLMHKSQFENNDSAQEIVDAVKFDGHYEERFKYINLLW
jgi:LmbE family N-acetylglucosaminyl deacetylase